MTNAGADLFANWACLLGGLWIMYDNWGKSVGMVMLGMLVVFAPLIIDRIARLP
jgi:hypothetical protein